MQCNDVAKTRVSSHKHTNTDCIILKACLLFQLSVCSLSNFMITATIFHCGCLIFIMESLSHIFTAMEISIEISFTSMLCKYSDVFFICVYACTVHSGFVCVCVVVVVFLFVRLLDPIRSIQSFFFCLN